MYWQKSDVWRYGPQYDILLLICNITIEATNFPRKILPLQQLTVRWLRIISVDSQSLTLVDFGLVPSSPISQITISLLLTVKETKLWTNAQETPDKNRRQSTACLTVVESTRSLQVTVICSTVITLSWRVNQHQRCLWRFYQSRHRTSLWTTSSPADPSFHKYVQWRTPELFFVLQRSDLHMNADHVLQTQVGAAKGHQAAE